MDSTEHENIPMSPELDAGEESPYLRRQRPVAVRRSRFSRRWRRLLLALFVLLLVGYIGYSLATFALTSPRFMLKSADDVRVMGNRFVSREEVLAALGLPPPGNLAEGVNIFRLPLEEKRKQVESIPWVRSASLTRAYPHRITVYVIERTPVAYVNIEGKLKLVDTDGMLLEKPERTAFDFPVLTGLDAASGGGERKSRLALYQEFDRQVTAEVARSGWQVSEVDLSDADDLKALLVQGRETIQMHFGHSDFIERFRNFLVMLPEMRKTNTKIDSVDLRYRNQVVVNPQPPTVEGENGPSEAGSRE